MKDNWDKYVRYIWIMIWDKYGYLTRVPPGPATEARRLPYPSHPLDRVPQAAQTRVDVQVCLLRFYHFC